MSYLDDLPEKYKYFTVAELAEIYHKPASSVYRDLIRTGAITKDLNEDITVDMVKDAHKKKMSIRQMMSTFGCSYNVVLQKLVWAGIYKR